MRDGKRGEMESEIRGDKCRGKGSEWTDRERGGREWERGGR